MNNMTSSKENYLEIQVKISKRAKWFLELQKMMDGLNVNCQKSFHITALFMKDDNLKDKLKEAFNRTLCHRYAPHLSFNKLDVFTNKSGTEHIVNLTSTSPEVEFKNLIEIMCFKI